VLSYIYKLRMPPKSAALKARRINRISALPFHRQVADILMNGKWSPGDRLSSEHELCRTYAVNRSVVRQASNELPKEGLIHKVGGQGLLRHKQDRFRVNRK
jgi:GntR family transcriptional regulator